MKAELVPLTHAQKVLGQYERRAMEVENEFLHGRNTLFFHQLQEVIEQLLNPLHIKKAQLALLYRLFSQHAIADIVCGYLQSSKSNLAQDEAQKYLTHYINRFLVTNSGIHLAADQWDSERHIVLDRIGTLALLSKCYESNEHLQNRYARERDFASLRVDCSEAGVVRVGSVIATPDHLQYWMQGRDQERVADFVRDFADKKLSTNFQMDFLGDVKKVEFSSSLSPQFVLMRDYPDQGEHTVIRSPFSGQDVYWLAKTLSSQLFFLIKNTSSSEGKK